MNARHISAVIALIVGLAIAASILATPIPARAKLPTRAPQPAPDPASDGYTLTPDAPRWQANTPAQVVGWVYGDETIFSGILIFNGGTSKLTEVQIGCFLEGLPDGVARPVDLGYVPFGTGPVEIAPNAVGMVTLAPLTLDDLSARIGDREMQEVVLTLGIVNANWASGKKFVAPDISNGFRQKPNAALEAKFTLAVEAHTYQTIEDLSSIWDLPIITLVPDDEDFYACRTMDGWRCLMRVGSNECGGSMRCLSCEGSTSKKCSKLVLPDEEDLPPL